MCQVKPEQQLTVWQTHTACNVVVLVQSVTSATREPRELRHVKFVGRSRSTYRILPWVTGAHRWHTPFPGILPGFLLPAFLPSSSSVFACPSLFFFFLLLRFVSALPPILLLLPSNSNSILFGTRDIVLCKNFTCSALLLTFDLPSALPAWTSSTVFRD